MRNPWAKSLSDLPVGTYSAKIVDVGVDGVVKTVVGGMDKPRLFQMVLDVEGEGEFYMNYILHGSDRKVYTYNLKSIRRVLSNLGLRTIPVHTAFAKSNLDLMKGFNVKLTISPVHQKGEIHTKWSIRKLN